MSYNDYGYRYPGGHSVVDDGFVPDEVTMPKRTKKSDTTWRPKTKPVRFESLKIGDRVKYGAAGEGTVTAFSEGCVYVKFDKNKGDSQPFKRATAEKNMKLVVSPEKRKPIGEKAAPKPGPKAAEGLKYEPIDFDTLHIGSVVSYGTLGIGVVRKIDKEKIYVEFDKKSGSAQPFKRSTAQKFMKKVVDHGKSETGPYPASAPGWQDCARLLVGTHVRDGHGRVGVVTYVGAGRMKIRYLSKEEDAEYPYPRAFVVGSVALLDKPDFELQQRRQNFASLHLRKMMGK